MADFDAKVMINRIERVLVEKGLSKEEFYAKSGISSASFSQWNTGVHKPTLKKVFSAAEALCVEPDYLLGRIDEPNPKIKSESKRIVIRKPKLTEEEKREYEEWEEEETYLAAKRLVESYENKKSPAHKGAELDPVTKELYDIVNTSDADELKALLEMARLLKKRRN